MANKKDKSDDTAHDAMLHLENLITSMALPFPKGYWLDPVICVVILLLYVTDDLMLLRARDQMQQDITVKDYWGTWVEAHRELKQKNQFRTAKEHLIAFFEDDMRIGARISDRGVLPPTPVDTDRDELAKSELRRDSLLRSLRRTSMSVS